MVFWVCILLLSGLGTPFFYFLCKKYFYSIYNLNTVNVLRREGFFEISVKRCVTGRPYILMKKIFVHFNENYLKG
jgi:hypothetical protein